jgi:hypothetical protein
VPCIFESLIKSLLAKWTNRKDERVQDAACTEPRKHKEP